MAEHPSAEIVHDETMDLADKIITKSSPAIRRRNDKYTWLVGNQSTEWSSEMQMTYVDVMDVLNNEDYVRQMKQGGQKWYGAQYIEF